MSLKGDFLEGYGVIHRSKGKIIQPSPRKISSLSPYSVGHKTKHSNNFNLCISLFKFQIIKEKNLTGPAWYRSHTWINLFYPGHCNYCTQTW